MICKISNTYYKNKCCHDDMCAYHEYLEFHRNNHTPLSTKESLVDLLQDEKICHASINFIKKKIEEIY